MKRFRKPILAMVAVLAVCAASIAQAGLGFQATFKAQQTGGDAKLGEVEVDRVNPGSAAERGGLKAGDRIEQINGKPVAGSSGNDFKNALGSLKHGQSVVLVVGRDGKHVTLTLTAD